MRTHFDPVLFDLDGTLIDSGKDIALSVNLTLVALGLPQLPEQEIIGFVGDGVRKLIERTLDKFGRRNVDEVVRSFKRIYRDNCLVHTVPYPGIRRLLRRLRGVRVGVVTNKVIDFSSLLLNGLELTRYIGTVVGGDETARLKPDPEPVRLACQRLGVNPDRGIMVGDHPNDVAAGRSAGMTTCGVLWGFDQGTEVRHSRADRLCATALELEAFLFDR